jgi:hypothetical protein
MAFAQSYKGVVALMSALGRAVDQHSFAPRADHRFDVTFERHPDKPFEQRCQEGDALK